MRNLKKSPAFFFKTLALVLAIILTFGILPFTYLFTSAAGLFPAYRFDTYTTTPVIDGTLDLNGYAKINIKPDEMTYYWDPSNINGEDMAKNLAFDVYASYDADYVYLFVSMDAAYYNNNCTSATAGDLWNQSGIQVGFARIDDEGGTRLEYGIGKNSTTDELLFYCWSQYPGAGQTIDLTGGTDFAVTLAGGKINYEVRTPVEAFMPAGTQLKQGDRFGFCLVMVQNDNGWIHTQVASGITGGKNSENFALITLGEDLPVPLDVPISANYASINIDGVRDGSYGAMVDIKSDEKGVVTNGATGKVCSAWDNNFLYYYLEVTDTTPNHEHETDWERDSIEFFIDWYNNKGSDMNNGGNPYWQLRIASAPNEEGEQITGHINGAWGAAALYDTQYVVKPLAGNDLSGGYIMEVGIPYKQLGLKLSANSVLGVDFAINDNQDGDGRTTAALLTEFDYGTQYGNPAGCHGALRLLASPTTDPPDPPPPLGGETGGTTATPPADVDEKGGNAVTVLINGKETKIAVTENGVLEIIYTDADIKKQQDDTGEYTIIIAKLENINITVPIAALGSDNLVIKTDFGVIAVPNETLKALAEKYGGEIKIVIKKGSFVVSLFDKKGKEIAYNDPKNPLTITLPYKLAEGQKPESVVAVKKTGDKNKIYPLGVYKDGEIKFDITATGTYDIIYNKKEFNDINNHWAANYIHFVTARDIAGGTGDGAFSPDAIVNRALFAYELAKLDGADLSKYKISSFGDVPNNAWYMAAVEWAAENGIIHGVGGNQFAPNANVTREQMAAMFYRYINYKKYDLKAAAEKNIFADDHKINGWAKESVENIQIMGIINGKPNNLFDPQGIATRGEIAAIFTRFIDAVNK